MNNREILAISIITAIISIYLMLACFSERSRYLMSIRFFIKIKTLVITILSVSISKMEFLFIYNKQRVSGSGALI